LSRERAYARDDADTWGPDGRGRRREREGARTATDRWSPPVRRQGRARTALLVWVGLNWAEFGFPFYPNF
jgi:hypothetical protein